MLFRSIDWYIIDFAWYVVLFFIIWTFSIESLSTVQGLTIVGTIVGLGALLGIVLTFLVKRNHK